MSLATLKKKSQVLYNNLSVGTDGFSLNGGHRSAGYIGQSTQSRHLTRTLAKNNVLRGISGPSPIINVKPSELACLNNPNVVKPTTINTSGMIHTKYKWFWSGKQSVKPDSNHHSIQSERTETLAKKTISCANTSYESPVATNINCNSIPTLARPRNSSLFRGLLRHRPVCTVTKPETTFVAMTYEQYLQKLNADCKSNDEKPVTHNCNCPLPAASSSA